MKPIKIKAKHIFLTGRNLSPDCLPVPFDEFVQNLPEDQEIKINDLIKYRFPIPLKILMKNGNIHVGYVIAAPYHQDKSVTMLKLILMNRLLGFDSQSKRFGQVEYSIYPKYIEKIFLISAPFKLKPVGRFYEVSEQFSKDLPKLEYKKKSKSNKTKQEDKMVEGYCVRCKKKVEMQEVEIGKTSKGVELRRGICPHCKGKVCRIGRIK